MYHVSPEYKAVIELAKTVGELQKKYFRSSHLKINTKTSHADLVTEVDIKCDEKIVAFLSEHFKGDAILSEEQGLKEGNNEYKWIVDPLDGTTNYAIGLPVFAVSIARWKGDAPVFAVVYCPVFEDLFYAEKSKGAYFNGQLCQVSGKTALKESILATGFPYDRATAFNHNGQNISEMIPRVKGVRRMGAAAYDISLVAAGVFDGFWELRLSLWDIAAAMLLVEEAGGRFYTKFSNGQYNVICGNREICQAIDEVVDWEHE